MMPSSSHTGIGYNFNFERYLRSREVPRNIDEGEDRGRPVHRVHTGGKGKGTGTGTERALSQDAPSHATVGLTRLATAVEKLISNLDGSAEVVNIGSKDLEKKLQKLPSALRKVLISRRRTLEDNFKKLYIAIDAVSKASNTQSWHPMARLALEKQWQVSRAELAAAAEQGCSWNTKVKWEELCLRQARDIQEFTKNTAEYQKQLFTSLTSLISFGKDLEIHVSEYLSSVPNAFSNRDRVRMFEIAFQWGQASHSYLSAKFEAEHAKKLKKKAKFNEELAKSKSTVEQMGTNELLVRALLEANQIFPPQESPVLKDVRATGADESRVTVPATSALGQLLKQSPDLASKFKIKILEDATPRNPTKVRRGSASRTSTRTSKKKMPSSSRISSHSSKSSSRNTSSSKSSSSKHLRNSRRPSSDKSGTGRSRLRSSSSNCSFHSLSSSSSKQSSRSKEKVKRKSKDKKRTSFNKHPSSRGSSRSSRASSSYMKPVFQKTPYPSPRR